MTPVLIEDISVMTATYCRMQAEKSGFRHVWVKQNMSPMVFRIWIVAFDGQKYEAPEHHKPNGKGGVSYEWMLEIISSSQIVNPLSLANWNWCSTPTQLGISTLHLMINNGVLFASAPAYQPIGIGGTNKHSGTMAPYQFVPKASPVSPKKKAK